MDWQAILTWSFLIALVTAGIRLAIPVLLAVLGEIITERAGVLNLGLEGMMIVGSVVGFMTAYALENGPAGAALGQGAAWLGLLAGMLAGAAMGLLMAWLSVTLKADQVISSVTLVLFGHGLAAYLYRQTFSAMTARVNGMALVTLPGLSRIPVLGEILFRHDPTVYLTFFLVGAVWVFLFHTTWGLKIRAAGENPAAAETSGVNVARTRYAATLLGAALAGLGGAVLTVVQLKLFRENITAGRGWIAVALVIFARWRPELGLLGALLFGLADSLQFRIQALSQAERGVGVVPYEFLLMLPYVLTLLALLIRGKRSDAPAALGQPYEKGAH